MIIGYVGNIGSGKTLSAVIELYKLYLDGMKIYSNIHLNFPYYPLTLDILLSYVETKKNLDGSVIFIDEVHMWVDSRNSANKRNRILSYVWLQSRKRHCNYFFTTQYEDQIDKRLRRVTEILVECNKLRYSEVESEYVFLNTINIKKNRNIIQKKRFFYGDEWFNLYDTNEVVKIEEKSVEEQIIQAQKFLKKHDR